MPVVTRQLALLKKVNLGFLADGWDLCYATVRKASYQEATAFWDDAKLKEDDNAYSFKKQSKFVADHFVAGKILVMNEDDSSGLVDMTAADTKWSAQLNNALFNAIMGIESDPKDS